MKTNSSSTTIILEESSFGVYSPINCRKLNMIGYLFSLLFTISLFQNIFILLKFWMNKKLRSSHHILIITLTIFNFIGTLTHYPVIITSKFKCKWVFDKIGCDLSSFTVLFTATISIYLMMLISLER